MALMMEGKFSGEGGLHSMDADDDMLAAMAREIVESGGVGDSADAVWEELRKERTAHLPPKPAAEVVPAMEMESEIPSSERVAVLESSKRSTLDPCFQ